MSFVLDGIPTAMVESDYNGFDGSKLGDQVECPCGWVKVTSPRDMAEDESVAAALRFHYTHCSRARGYGLDLRGATTGEVEP